MFPSKPCVPLSLPSFMKEDIMSMNVMEQHPAMAERDEDEQEPHEDEPMVGRDKHQAVVPWGGGARRRPWAEGGVGWRPAAKRTGDRT
jgi:hypothetical protein